MLKSDNIGPRCQCHKTFSSVTNADTKKARVLVLGKPFQPSLIFEGKAGSLPHGRAPKRYYTPACSGLTKNIRLGSRGLPGTNTLFCFGINTFSLVIKTATSRVTR